MGNPPFPKERDNGHIGGPLAYATPGDDVDDAVVDSIDLPADPSGPGQKARDGWGRGKDAKPESFCRQRPSIHEDFESIHQF